MTVRNGARTNGGVPAFFSRRAPHAISKFAAEAVSALPLTWVCAEIDMHEIKKDPDELR